MTKNNNILEVQLVWTTMVFGILLTVLVNLLNQNFESSKFDIFGATEAQPQIF